uniref:ANK_REP_REGION domain-containing protein n=1 Tax=Globodera pallida TaxID=36090 RepID=A0A183C8H4_GLOPA
MLNQKDNFTSKELKILTDEERELFQLIQEDKIEEAKTIVQNGKVRVNSLDKNGMSVLDLACFKGNEAFVEFLIENGANPDNRAHQDGYTALMFAALSGNGRLCQLLLDAGANSLAQNMIGQHECVSIITNYISFRDVDLILHPKGAESDVIYPPELVQFIQLLTRTHAFHPVKLTFDVSENGLVWQHVKKTVFTLDTLFEKQLRSKQPNEVLSLKLWIVL